MNASLHGTLTILNKRLASLPAEVESMWSRSQPPLLQSSLDPSSLGLSRQLVCQSDSRILNAHRREIGSLEFLFRELFQ